jgi:hypothetical protein
MTIYTISMTDHFDASGTDGGFPYIALTVSHEGKPQTDIRIDFETDGKPAILKATNRRSPIDFYPIGFSSHLDLACAAWTFIQTAHDRTDNEQYSELFEVADLLWTT